MHGDCTDSFTLRRYSHSSAHSNSNLIEGERTHTRERGNRIGKHVRMNRYYMRMHNTVDPDEPNSRCAIDFVHYHFHLIPQPLMAIDGIVFNICIFPKWQMRFRWRVSVCEISDNTDRNPIDEWISMRMTKFRWRDVCRKPRFTRFNSIRPIVSAVSAFRSNARRLQRIRSSNSLAFNSFKFIYL